MAYVLQFIYVFVDMVIPNYGSVFQDIFDWIDVVCWLDSLLA